jgi:hypothetical protein
MIDGPFFARMITRADAHQLTYPWNSNPVIYLDNVQQRTCKMKCPTLRPSVVHSERLSFQECLQPISYRFDYVQTIRTQLRTLNDSQLDTMTQFGKEIMIITADILLHVVRQIGQAYIRTLTLESMIAFIRRHMETRREYMRDNMAGVLLISWYELSKLMSCLQTEPELRITKTKVEQLIDLCHQTANWAVKYLIREYSHENNIDLNECVSATHIDE